MYRRRIGEVLIILDPSLTWRRRPVDAALQYPFLAAAVDPLHEVSPPATDFGNAVLYLQGLSFSALAASPLSLPLLVGF